MQYYLTYLRDGKYQKVNAYNRTPFWLKVDKTQPQILWQEFTVTFKDSVRFDLNINFEESGVRKLQVYGEKKSLVQQHFEAKDFTKEYKIGDKVDLPFFSATFEPHQYM